MSGQTGTSVNMSPGIDWFNLITEPAFFRLTLLRRVALSLRELHGCTARWPQAKELQSLNRSGSRAGFQAAPPENLKHTTHQIRHMYSTAKSQSWRLRAIEFVLRLPS